METSGKLESIMQDFRTKEYLVTLRMPDLPVDLENAVLDIKMVKHREHRSKDANALLWASIGEMAHALNTDKWEVYLMLLKRYGIFRTISCKLDAVSDIRQAWRETEVVDTTTDGHGEVIATMNCYIGSSNYNSKEMSYLIDGLKSEMHDLGLQLPPSTELQRALTEWENRHG